MYKHICDNKLLTPNQSGFRHGDSTVNQLLYITHLIYTAFEEYPTSETTLYNVCAVPWGVFSTMGVFSTVGDIMSTVGGYLEYRGGVQYRGGYHDICGGYLEYRGVFSTVGDIMSTVGGLS